MKSNVEQEFNIAGFQDWHKEMKEYLEELGNELDKEPEHIDITEILTVANKFRWRANVFLDNWTRHFINQHFYGGAL